MSGVRKTDRIALFLLTIALWNDIVGQSLGLAILGRDVSPTDSNTPQTTHQPNEVTGDPIAASHSELIEQMDHVSHPLSFNEGEDEVEHKIVAKSVKGRNFLDIHAIPVSLPEHSVRTSQYHEEIEASKSGGNRAVADSSNTAPKSDESWNTDEEDKIFQEIMAARKDAIRLRVRNSSELHVDDHNDSEPVTHKQLLRNSLNSIVVLPKPFHFHVPIIAESFHTKRSEKGTSPVKKVEVPLRKQKPKRQGDRRKGDEISLSSSSEEVGYRGKSIQSRGRLRRRRDTHEIAAAEVANENTPFHSLYPKLHTFKDSHEERLKLDLDALIDQHPKLVPPVNRKRNSDHGERPESFDDESHHFMMVFQRYPNDEEFEVDEDQGKVTAIKREVKTMNFSQDLVDSILGHEDDFVKYRNKIKIQAEKLGVSPHEVFDKLVYGNSSNELKGKKDILNSTPFEIQQRKSQFQQLFLGDSDGSGKRRNEIIFGENDNDDDDNIQDKRYSAYMKIFRREKRGLKSWFKKLFKHEEKPEPTKAPPHATTTQAPRRKVSNSDAEEKKASKRKRVMVRVLDENGDTEVDLLLPKPLRRSSYLKKLDEIKEKIKEEQEFEEEYEKSEEKEVKVRDGSYEKNEDESDEDRDKPNSSRRRRRKERSVDDKGGLPPPIEENMEDESEVKMNDELSKDEILLVHEMLLNIINFRCEQVSRSILDSVLSITQIVVGMSNLPEYIIERRYNVDKLFDQILNCSGSEENLSKWKHGGSKVVGKAGVSDSDKPLKRIKRIRRQDDNVGVGNERTTEEISSKVELEEKMEVETEVETDSMARTKPNYSGESEARLGGTIIPRLMKLHILIYKIIMETCWNFVDSILLHDSVLTLVEEFFQISKSQRKRSEIESFAKHFDMTFAERSFLECYQRKD